MPKKILLLILVVSLSFLVSALSVSAEDTSCARVFKSNCNACHGLDRGCELLGQSPKEWTELFEFMEGMGADIPEDEQKLLAECLSAPDDDVKAACE